MGIYFGGSGKKIKIGGRNFGGF